MKQVSHKLKQIRMERHLSQTQVATRLGITRSAYANYEQGIREPDIQMLKKLCAVFEISADDLLGIND